MYEPLHPLLGCGLDENISIFLKMRTFLNFNCVSSRRHVFLWEKFCYSDFKCTQTVNIAVGGSISIQTEFLEMYFSYGFSQQLSNVLSFFGVFKLLCDFLVKKNATVKS